MVAVEETDRELLLNVCSYHGKYFYRSGSTKRTITGKELDKAILKSQGRIWDGMPIPKLQVTDLRREAIDLFKEKALRRHRLTEEETRLDILAIPILI